MPGRAARHAAARPAPTTDRDCDSATLDARDAERDGHAELEPMEGMRMLQATASSTGVDHHGTERPWRPCAAWPNR